MSPTLISNVTDAVLEDERARQSRALVDARMVRMRNNGQVQNRAV